MGVCKHRNESTMRDGGLSRRDFLGRLAAGAAVLAWPGTVAADALADKRTNVILILADDVSANAFSCYGNATAKTPHLEALARTGAMFKTCWCTPLCSPSRAAIMTGRYGFRTQWYDNNGIGRREPLCSLHQTIGQVMKAGGYATAVAGKWQLPGKYKDHGFDEHCMWIPMPKPGEFDAPIEPNNGSLPGRAARYWHPAIIRNDERLKTTDDDYGPDIFVNFVNDFVTRHKNQPCFVYYPMCLPHTTWDFERKKDGYVAPPLLDETGSVKKGKGAPTLEADVQYVDHLVGRIVQHLEKEGLRDRTVILFTGDNGTAGYGKGRVVEERGQRVPLIVNGPGRVKPIGASDELVDFSDMLPTVAGLTGISLPKDYVIDGHSFAPLLSGQPYAGREWIFSYLGDKRMLRDKRWLIDGNGRFYDCGDRRNEKGYKDVTNSEDPEVSAARKRFGAILEKLPAPNLRGKPPAHAGKAADDE